MIIAYLLGVMKYAQQERGVIIALKNVRAEMEPNANLRVDSAFAHQVQYKPNKIFKKFIYLMIQVIY